MDAKSIQWIRWGLLKFLKLSNVASDQYFDNMYHTGERHFVILNHTGVKDGKYFDNPFYAVDDKYFDNLFLC